MHDVATSVMLQIDIPADLVDEETPQPLLETLGREALVVRLFALGHISSGKAAAVLSISRRAFLALLDQYGVALFDDVALEDDTAF